VSLTASPPHLLLSVMAVTTQVRSPGS
jgi:hypothetical protein